MSGPDWIGTILLTFRHELSLTGAGNLFPLLFVGLMAAWVILSSIPAFLLSAADEGTIQMIEPAQARPHDALFLTALGGLAGAIMLSLTVPVISPLLPPLHRALLPHHAWIAWSAVIFLVLTEIPRSQRAPLGRWAAFTHGMAPVLGGIAVLALSGVLGLLLFYRSPLPAASAPFTFLPALIGVFAMPGLLRSRGPGSQGYPVKAAPSRRTPDLQPKTLGKHLTMHCSCISGLQGLGGGMLAGGLTVISPILTATTGCLLADRLAGPTPGPRLIAQGAARMTALGGGLLLVFLPGTPRLHSSAGALLRSAYVPEPMDAVWPYALILVIGAGLACLALQPMARGLARLIQRRGQSLISGLAALCLVLIVAALAGGIGLVVLATSTGIGLIAPLFNARPVHGVGLILIPMACQVSGFGPDLANWLGWFP